MPGPVVPQSGRRSVPRSDRRTPCPKAIVDAQGQHVHVLTERSFRKPAKRASVVVKELLAFPIQRWSYSMPNDQFGVKPYSKPTPNVPPQRVAPDVTRPTPVAVSRTLK